MRLKHIKLAGFKSFVDPTTVPFEKQMTAIVGPNGCGKSNIIDAVRWVLGESSAKNLRGDTMTDVIFNGSSTRKPIGQASIELVFDNTSGRIQGSMADRNEVSIRRVVNRESVNSYFLNGSKCRRRDITDIFLGTGLGPRSYAIIEQGTISRLIESKPQELRVFIEEAAGISKYKERRKETETRIKHTRENLVRLADIRSELAIRLDTLHQQAQAAKRFRTLKKRERQYRAELAVLRWQQYQDKEQAFARSLEEVQTQIETLNLQTVKHENSLHEIKQSAVNNSEETAKYQQEKLEISSQIARTEQNIKHVTLKQNVLKKEQAVTAEKINDATQQLKVQTSKLHDLSIQKEQTQPKLNQCEKQLTKSYQTLETKQRALNEWQGEWQSFHQEKNNYSAELSTLENAVQHQQRIVESHIQKKYELEQHINELNEKNSCLLDESADTKLVDLTRAHDKLKHDLSLAHQNLESQQNRLLLRQQEQAKLAGKQQALDTTIEQLSKQLSARDNWQLKQQEYIQNHGQIDQQLADLLNIEKGWENAVEQVLSRWLKGSLADQSLLDHIAQSFSKPEKSEKNALPKQAMFLWRSEKNIIVKPGTLAEKVTLNAVDSTQQIDTILSILNQVVLVENIAQAIDILPSLSPTQSVMCNEEFWLSHQFFIRGVTETNHDMLNQRAALKESASQNQFIEQNLANIVEDIQALTTKIANDKTAVQKLISLEKSKHDELLALKNHITLTEQKQVQNQQQILRYTNELNEIAKQYEKESKELTQAKERLTLFKQSFSNNQTQRASFDESLGEVIQKNIAQQQRSIQSLSDEKHHLAIEVERLSNLISNAQLMQQQLQEQINRLTIQQKEQTLALEESIIPLAHDQQQLDAKLKSLADVEKKLIDIHQLHASANDMTETLEREKQKSLNEVAKLKEAANKYHLEVESYKLRSQSVLDQVKEMSVDFADVQKDMPKNAKEQIWQAHLIKIAKDIGLLGPINLAAINEYEEQFDRKAYLDKQDNDLVEALSTLESAIVKIDKQSRHQFRVTFDQVNKDLKSLFPKVFGGGSAYLDLTGDDMLETGVTIMARPPGKKNSTIHLLSGGEKALTALSLVFAIFRLNPAPFCMLDEVDAPLDDANVERFCNLVREMSQTVQFIYISHNKIAMEMAAQLTGVTMFEAGVSRMVAVDIDEAMELAEIT